MSCIRGSQARIDTSQRIAPEALCHLLEREIRGSVASVMAFDAATATLQLIAGNSLPTLLRQRTRRIRVGAQFGSCGAAAYWRNTIVTRDIQRDPRWKNVRTAARRAELRSCWSTPIITPDHGLLGTLAVYTNRVGSPEPRAVEMTSAVASLLVPSLMRRRAC
ncbi:GAF domain-containing protein [Aquisalimonas lutea]|uniref:GAF domain-containing protein n=1 Tax=Aquisalimonas lutea TaxID=1327750 RepID=UPI0025B4D7C0|nr:GAF domain-containing protein [Aquisalimonas lutea]MDN3517274.1 GAF domain-containing protein [Aquisalimonas lutea]